jgi:hypothetical protein
MAKRTIGVPVDVYDEIQALRERLYNYEMTKLEHDEKFLELVGAYLPKDMSDDDQTVIQVRRSERIYLGR